MKTFIFWSMAMFVFYNQELFSQTLNENEFTKPISYEIEDIVSIEIFDIEPKSYMDVEFRIGISDGLEELKEKPQINNNLLDKVVVWMSYKF